jgi:hypothetical protein
MLAGQACALAGALIPLQTDAPTQLGDEPLTRRHVVVGHSIHVQLLSASRLIERRMPLDDAVSHHN